MREVRHITVAVSPEIYCQSRKLAAEMDSTGTAMVAYLLQRFPSALKAAGYNVTAPPRASHPVASKTPNPDPVPNCQACEYCAKPPPQTAISGCETVKPGQTT